MTTHGAALLGPQGHGHPLGCRYLHLLGDTPQHHRGPPLGGSSSVRLSSRRGLACSSTSSSSDESFCTCLEHARNVMNLCPFMCRAELLAQQPVLSGAIVFGACVCGRVIRMSRSLAYIGPRLRELEIIPYLVQTYA
eukprot:scaffold56777_cov64-Phaeocystis_antarctica.AAC.1